VEHGAVEDGPDRRDAWLAAIGHRGHGEWAYAIEVGGQLGGGEHVSFGLESLTQGGTPRAATRVKETLQRGQLIRAVPALAQRHSAATMNG
jgi:hypothetical protein